MNSVQKRKDPRFLLQMLVGILLLSQTCFSQGNTFTVPKDALHVDSSFPVGWTGIGFKAVPRNGTAAGAKVQYDFTEITNDGKARTYFMSDGFQSNKTAVTYLLE